MTTTPTTESIYDTNAHHWQRRERILLSDFTARPFVIDRLGPLEGQHVLDLGCGEGYVARLVAEGGAQSVFGIDVSKEMVETARNTVSANMKCEFTFETGNAASFQAFSRDQYDRVMAVFLFNYLTLGEMSAVIKTVKSRLAPGGRFVFTVPHPCFPYMRDKQAPFFFDTQGLGYFDGVDQTYEGSIWRRDGVAVPVRCVHKTLSDYFTALSSAGFTGMPIVEELHVTGEHLALDERFFGPLKGYPLHVLFSLG
jgi:SAM-dependent methyltransferase